MKRMIAMAAVLAALLVSGCASSRSGQVYSRSDAQKAQTVEMGVVTRVDQVRIEGTKSGTGAAVGGVAGGVLGSQVGKGSGSVVGAVVGALAGGAGGALAEEKITDKDGLEIEVKLDSGKTVVVAQEADVQFSVGQRVRVISSGATTRVRP